MPSERANTELQLNKFSLFHGAFLAFVGAFLDAFTFVEKGHVFANAMTGNVVLLGVYAGKAEWWQAFNHLLPIGAFMLAIITAAVLRRLRARHPFFRPATLCVVIEIFLLLLAGSMPEGLSNYYFTLSISFMATLQNTMFAEIEGQTLNTVMMTGNLRKLFGTIAERLFSPLRKDQRDTVRVFGVVALAFLLGAVVGGVLSPLLHNKALWIPCIFLAMVAFSLIKQYQASEPLPKAGSH